MINFKNLFKKEKIPTESSKEPEYLVKCIIQEKNGSKFTVSHFTSEKPEDKWEHYFSIRDWIMNETTEWFIIKTLDNDFIINRNDVQHIELSVSEV